MSYKCIATHIMNNVSCLAFICRVRGKYYGLESNARISIAFAAIAVFQILGCMATLIDCTNWHYVWEALT